MAVAIINPNLPNQREHGKALQAAGYKVSFDPYVIVPKREPVIISGPHYAYRTQIGHPRLIMLDRAWWGDPDYLAVSHVRKDGAIFRPERMVSGADLPEVKPWKTREQSCLVLLDYQQPQPAAVILAAKARFANVRIRRHPADVKEQVSLESHLALSDVAIGWKGTALAYAIIQGVPGICLDENNIAASISARSVSDTLVREDRAAWLRKVASAQVSIQEIADGILPTIFRSVFRG